VPIIPVPIDIPVPRAGIGAVAIPPMVVLEEIGLFPGAQQWIDFAVEQLTERRDQLTSDGSPAQELARVIGRTIPLIHGGSSLGAVAAARWKTQVNENANAPAFWNTHPELCHNEMQGWGQHGDVTRQVLTLVNLRHEFEHPQIARRFDVVRPMLEEVVAEVRDVWAEGEGELAQLLDLVMLGDFVSLHLAGQEGIDPGPMDTLDRIKQTVANG
jgi:glucose/mannose-6-phosphate isomerase